MKIFPFISSAQSLKMFRVVLALMLAAHGAMRLSVGHQSGGVEYSVLIIFSMLVIAASAKK